MTMAVLIRFWLPFFAVCGLAFWRGGQPERVAAAALVAAGLGTLAAKSLLLSVGAPIQAVDVARAVIDVLLLLCLLLLTVRANRLWPIFLTATHALTVLGHVARWTMPSLWRLGFDLLTIAPAYLGLIALLVGTLAHQHRLKKYGVDASWRPRSRLPVSNSQMG